MGTSRSFWFRDMGSGPVNSTWRDGHFLKGTKWQHSGQMGHNLQNGINNRNTITQAH